ncbi:MAG: DegT/DnrJ/EryC1/StrS family aminotransferase, partial [candidate division Zixibacteria bacterium]|nr:DegT/DnrJ/EryC1/StrS family aminotransferase [candidate division Zixibacteria bacterium]
GGSEYHHELIGFNSRLDTLQAALLLVKLPHLDKWSLARRANAEYYNQRFAEANLKTPKVENYAYHIYNQYTILVENRDALRQHLLDKKIGNKIYYPVPLHLQACFASLGYGKGSLPVAEECANKALSLPIYSHLAENEREYVADTVLSLVS